MMIEFKNVGRGKISWEEPIRSDFDMVDLIRLVKKKKVLMSKDIDCCCATDDEDQGHIFAGTQCVGEWYADDRP